MYWEHSIRPSLERSMEYDADMLTPNNAIKWNFAIGRTPDC